MPKQWTLEEIALACKAYLGTTMNPIRGTSQDFNALNVTLIEKFEAISPSNCEDGTHYKRGTRTYPYLRDNVFPKIQKFNKALRTVYCSNPTG